MIIGDKIETETKTLQQERNACDISIAIIVSGMCHNARNRIMKNRYLTIFMLYGLFQGCYYASVVSALVRI